MKLRVWWIPQVPMKAFEVEVDNVKEGVLLLNTLADYDTFQFENNIKPDYSNVGGLKMWEDGVNDDGSGDWTDWEFDNGEEYWDDPIEYVESLS